VSDTKYSVEQFGPRIDAFLRMALDRAGFDVHYRILEGQTRHPDFENPDLLVTFSGRDVDILLENKAEVLLALEQLTMEALRMTPEEHSHLCFDANDYRMLRIEELRVSATTAADKVKRTGAPFRFNPMNSRERRIIHLALRDESAVRSESAGVGPYRQVVIYPANMPTQPEMAQAAAGPRFGPPRRGRRR
jgi:spoIIIJ-associated protein